MGCIWKAIRTFLMVVGAITVVIVIILGVGLYMLTQPSGLEGEMHEVVATPAAAQRFDQKIDNLEADLLLLAAGAPVSLALTEEEVTSKIAQELETADIPVEVEDIWVNFEDTKVMILGKVNVGITLSAGLELEMEVENGEPKIIISEVAIGRGFGIPEAAKEQIANAIPSAEALTKMLEDLPIKIKDIRIEDGKLIFSGIKK